VPCVQPLHCILERLIAKGGEGSVWQVRLLATAGSSTPGLGLQDRYSGRNISNCSNNRLQQQQLQLIAADCS
jgi:hypothetical protein